MAARYFVGLDLGQSQDYTALAGHLLDAKVRGAAEFFVYPLNSKVVKVRNEGVGLYFYDFGHQ